MGWHFFSRGSSQPRDWTCIFYISCVDRQVLTTSSTCGMLKSCENTHWFGCLLPITFSGMRIPFLWELTLQLVCHACLGAAICTCFWWNEFRQRVQALDANWVHLCGFWCCPWIRCLSRDYRQPSFLPHEESYSALCENNRAQNTKRHRHEDGVGILTAFEVIVIPDVQIVPWFLPSSLFCLIPN